MINIITTRCSDNMTTDILTTEQQIRDTHMKYRCYWMTVLCGLSTYDLYNNSYYAPLDISWFSVSSINCMIMVSYLSWDSWAMFVGCNKTILYRTELAIHHVAALCTWTFGFIFAPIIGSFCIIGETLSVLNYIFRDKSYETVLHIYRIFVIFCIRMPIQMYSGYFMWYDSIHHWTFDHIDHQLVSYIGVGICIFFFMYDMVLLHKIIGILKYKNRKIE